MPKLDDGVIIIKDFDFGRFVNEARSKYPDLGAFSLEQYDWPDTPIVTLVKYAYKIGLIPVDEGRTEMLFLWKDKTTNTEYLGHGCIAENAILLKKMIEKVERKGKSLWLIGEFSKDRNIFTVTGEKYIMTMQGLACSP